MIYEDGVPQGVEGDVSGSHVLISDLVVSTGSGGGNTYLVGHPIGEVLPAPSAPFTPSDMTTALWLDASDVASVTYATQLASQWNDKSGNGRHVVQAVEVNRPSYTTQTINGLNAIEFTGSESLATAAAATWLNSTEYFVIGVAQNVTYEDSNCFIGVPGSEVGRAAAWGTNAAANEFSVEHLSGGSNVAKYASGSSALNPYMYGCKFNSPGAELFRDGNSLGVDVTAPDIDLAITVEPFTVGDISPLGYEYVGYVGEVIFVIGTISTSDRQKLEGYLAHKWSLTANLPAEHPYKAVAP